MLVNGEKARKSLTQSAELGSADDIQHRAQHQQPEIRHNFEVNSQHRRDFKFGFIAGASAEIALALALAPNLKSPTV